MNPGQISKELKLETAIIQRWAVIFGGEELRDRMMFESYRKISGLRDRYSQNIGERHDRIAGSIEQVAEQLLADVHNGKSELTPKDLSTLAGSIKQTQDIRRTVRGMEVDCKESRVDINVNIPTSMERLANAVLDAQIGPPQLKQIESKRIAVEIGESLESDEQYEEAS